jgi:hypothetical protein
LPRDEEFRPVGIVPTTNRTRHSEQSRAHPRTYRIEVRLELPLGQGLSRRMLGSGVRKGNVRVDEPPPPPPPPLLHPSLLLRRNVPAERFAFGRIVAVLLLLVFVVGVVVGLVGGRHRYGGDAVASREDGSHLELDHGSSIAIAVIVCLCLCLLRWRSCSFELVKWGGSLPAAKCEVKKKTPNTHWRRTCNKSLENRTQAQHTLAAHTRAAESPRHTHAHTRKRRTTQPTTQPRQKTQRVFGFGPFRWNVGVGAWLASVHSRMKNITIKIG